MSSMLWSIRFALLAKRRRDSTMKDGKLSELFTLILMIIICLKKKKLIMMKVGNMIELIKNEKFLDLQL